MTFGDRLASLMKQRGLKNPDIATAAGVHPGSVSKWRSDVMEPDEATITLLASLLNTTPWFLRYGIRGGPDDESTLGKRIANARRAAQLSQVELGAAAGVTNSSRWESGEHEPSLDMLRKIATVLGVDPCWLAFGNIEEK